MSEPEDSSHLEPYEGVFQDLAEAKIIPPKWVITDLLPVGLTFLAAPPKSGKSTLTLAASTLVAGFKCPVLPPFLSHVPQDGIVMVFSYEAEAGELRYMVEMEMGIPLTNNGSILVADDPWKFRLDDPEGLKQMLFWLNQYKPKLVILDPLRDFHSKDEDDSGEMNRLLRPLRTWGIKNDSAFVVVHHTKKPGEGQTKYGFSDMRGSSALYGIADGVLICSPIEKQTNTISITTKFKKGKAWERTIQMAVYEDKDRTASEMLTELDKQMWQGLFNCELELSVWYGTVKTGDNGRLRDVVQKLKRNGMVEEVNGKWRQKR